MNAELKPLRTITVSRNELLHVTQSDEGIALVSEVTDKGIPRKGEPLRIPAHVLGELILALQNRQDAIRGNLP